MELKLSTYLGYVSDLLNDIKKFPTVVQQDGLSSYINARVWVDKLDYLENLTNCIILPSEQEDDPVEIASLRSEVARLEAEKRALCSAIEISMAYADDDTEDAQMYERQTRLELILGILEGALDSVSEETTALSPSTDEGEESDE